MEHSKSYPKFRSLFLEIMGFEEEPKEIPSELETAIKQTYGTIVDAAEHCHMFLNPSSGFKKPKINITDNR